MRHRRMSEIIERGISRSQSILFNPFHMKKWLMLIFIAIFAGSLSFGNSFNFNNNASKNKAVKGEKEQVKPRQTATEQSGTQQALSAQEKRIVFAVVAVVVFFIVCFTLVMMWLSSHFRFIWFNAIATNDASIIGPFYKHRTQGNSMFKAALIIFAIFLSAFLSIAGWGVFNAFRTGVFKSGFAWSLPVALHIFLGPIIALVLLFIIGIILTVLIDHFVVMIMALEKISFMKAFKKALKIYKDNLGDIVLFNTILFLLWIVCSVIMSILAIILLLVFILLALILGFAGYFLFVTLFKLKLVFIAYCVLLGIPWFILLFLSMLFVALPFAVFFRAYSIEYLCSLDGAYTYDTLAEYAKERSNGRSRAIVILPIVLMCAMSLLSVTAILAAIAIPNFIKARSAAEAKSAEVCRINLAAIDTSKKAWARDTVAAESTAPTWNDLVPTYLLKKPSCPKNGTYSIRNISEPPRCSIGGNGTVDVSDDHVVESK